MVVAADYPFVEIVWTMVVFFGWVIWIWTLVMVLSDVFRRPDLTGAAKAGWTIVLLVLPFIGVLIYLVVHGQGMGERRSRDTRAASELAQAKRLLDDGVIDEKEFAKLKGDVLY